MPVTAAREVMGFVFLPVVDLFRSCGVPCCFCNNAPGLCRGYYEGDDSDDSEEEYSDGDDETNKNDDTEGVDDSYYPDEESQWKDVLQLFRSCGVPCCFRNNAPGLYRGYYEGDDSDSEEEYSDGDDETNENDDTEGIDDSDYPDEESQWKDVLQPLEFIAIDRG
eukprot:jgi/Psemu1/312673/fgenesh1_kg.999_\